MKIVSIDVALSIFVVQCKEGLKLNPLVSLYFSELKNFNISLHRDFIWAFVNLVVNDSFVVVVARVDDGLAEVFFVDEASILTVEEFESGLKAIDGRLSHIICLFV